MRVLMKPKRITPIKATKLGSQRVIKPPTRPSEELNVCRPNLEQVVSETCGEFSSDSNIFEVEAENDEHERPDTEEYQLTIWKTVGFRIVFDE